MLHDGSESRMVVVCDHPGESPARDDSTEWTSEPQSEIYLIFREEYPSRVAPVTGLEHKPNGRA